jgi:large conductance mechanosensitive channel
MMKKQIYGFMDFVREQGVVGLAVGLVLGTAVKSVVDSLVQNIINPIVGLLLGSQQGLVGLGVTVSGARVKYGEFLNTVIQFLIMAAVVYFIVKGLKLDRLDRKKDAPPTITEQAKENIAKPDELKESKPKKPSMAAAKRPVRKK